MNTNINKKSISPLIATVLLIVVAVGLILIILNWGKSFTHESVKTINYASFSESDLDGYIFVKKIFESTDGTDSRLILDNRDKVKDANIIAYKILDLDPSKSDITDIYYEYDEPVLLQHGHSKDLNVICFPSNEFDIEFYTSDEKCFKVNVFDSSLSCQSCLNLPYCGDSSCNGDETANTCYSDCGSCGDGICTSGEENMTSCYTDCGSCGDGICTSGEENATTCYDDCGECGNSILEGPETCDSDTESCTTSVLGITYVGTHTCLGDCSAYETCTTTKSCGDGVCQNTGGDGETVSNCVSDCHSCGDGVCSDGYETYLNCPSDCDYVYYFYEDGTENISFSQSIGYSPYVLLENDFNVYFESGRDGAVCWESDEKFNVSTFDKLKLKYSLDSFAKINFKFGISENSGTNQFDFLDYLWVSNYLDSGNYSSEFDISRTGMYYLKICTVAGETGNILFLNKFSGEGTEPTVCGDGICDLGENANDCVSDCHSCGDGVCSDGYETEASCPVDCLQYTCSLGDTDNGDGTCTALIDASYDNSLKFTTSYFDYDATTGVLINGTYNSVGSYESGGAAPALCVLEDTLINILRNDYEKEVFVQDVLLSDYILSWDFDKNEYLYVPILQKFNNTINEYYIINNKLKVTSLHPIYIKDKGFIYPKDITYDDYLLNSNGDFEKINSIKFVENVNENIYNFETGNHFYFANGYLTHNAPGEPEDILYRSYFFFDTSYISSYGTVSSADFKFKANLYSNYYDLVLQKTVNSAYPHNPLQTGDFDESYYSGDLGSILSSNIGVDNTISLNSTGLTEVTNSLGDTFKFVLRSKCDIDNSCSSQYVNTIDIYRYNSANPPQLEVTYAPTSQAYCGNGVVETGEDCECGVGNYSDSGLSTACLQNSGELPSCTACIFTYGGPA